MENSDTGALAVTRDYPQILSVDILTIRIVAIFSRIRISRILSENTIRIPVSVVNTGAHNAWSYEAKIVGHGNLNHLGWSGSASTAQRTNSPRTDSMVL